MEHLVELKRAYDAAAAGDGFRVYIDRLWPRGLSHETFHYDLWDTFAALLETIASKPKVTLLYSSHDRAHNNAEVVAAALASEGWKCVSS